MSMRRRLEEDPPSLYRHPKGRIREIKNEEYDGSYGPKRIATYWIPIGLTERLKERCMRERVSVSPVISKLIADYLGPEEEEDSFWK